MDFNAPRSFTSASINFLRIIELTKDKEMASEIKGFVTSDLLTPRYTPTHHHAEKGRKLNHFHVFWNMIHQLPFAVKTWDKKTVDILKLFYTVWVTATLLCEYCRGHYKSWIKKHPPTVNDLVSLNRWIFRLHNDVNKRSSKPQFQWQNYNERWGPPAWQASNQRYLQNFRPMAPKKNSNVREGFTRERRSWRDRSKQSSPDWRGEGYPSPSPSSTNTNSRSQSGGDVGFDNYYRTPTPKKPVQPQHLGVNFDSSLPNNCLSKRKLRLRRKKVNKQKRFSAPRIRVARRGREI